MFRAMFSSCFSFVCIKTSIGPIPNDQLVLPVPKMVWSFWFGPHMTGKRLEAFNSLKENIGVNLTMVTFSNLHDFEVEEHPFHPARCSIEQCPLTFGTCSCFPRTQMENHPSLAECPCSWVFSHAS